MPAVDNEHVRTKPDRRESMLGLALCLLGCAIGAAFSWWTDFGWLPVYLAGLAFIAVALPFPTKLRPWPLFPPTIMMILWGIGIVFIGLFAGGGVLAVINLPFAAAYVAGTLVVFDAAW
jgi:hypothetical protein